MSQNNFIPAEVGSSNSNVQQSQEEIGTGRLPTNIQITATATGHHTTFVPPHSSIKTGYTIHQQQQLVGHRTQTINPNLNTAQQPIIIHQAPPMIQQQQPQQSNTTVKNKRLQVDDALSYLERVRQEFAKTPERYNEFLEVMKQFKNHTIDTQKVILQVSTIFRSHPELIIGFNTFLPPGFQVNVVGNCIHIDQPNGDRIEINNEADQPTIVEGPGQLMQSFSTVQIPQVAPTEMINRIQQQVTANIVAQENEVIVQTQEPPEMHSIPMPSPKRRAVQMSSTRIPKETMQHISIQPTATSQLQQPQLQPMASIDLIEPNNATQQQEPILIGSPSQSQQQQPIHFEQALRYLNKIKERFSNKPEIYQQFMAILVNYQRSDGDQKLTESGVYQEVAKLFQNEMDLMRDFRDFLPDASLDISDSQTDKLKQLEMCGREKSSSSAEQSLDEQIGSGRHTAVSTSTTTSSFGAKKRPLSSTTAGQSDAIAAKKSKGQTNKITYETPTSEILEEIPIKDFIFFEKIKNALQSEAVFLNFMRSLSLYTKSVLSKGELFDFVQPFLAGHPALLKEFKDILGGKKEIEQHPNKQIPIEERLPSDKANNIDFTHSKTLGQSYRRLPDNYEQPICSGRTKLDKEVLNDKIRIYKRVCYPQWASENTSSSTKKSSFEEIMCRTEDERFEVDILIETLQVAYHALRYAESKIEGMNDEEARKWMVENENNLGCSYTVISRAVRKLYGEATNKILAAMRENPLVAIPTVHGRMYDKENECIAVRDNDYKMIWREQIEKNYLKSLDVQSLTFKANDGKYIRTRNIIGQLESIYEERREKQEKGQPIDYGPHLLIEYTEDKQIFQDANELIRHFAKRHLNLREKQGIEKILSSLIPRLFQLTGNYMDHSENAEAIESEEIMEKGDECESMTNNNLHLTMEINDESNGQKKLHENGIGVREMQSTSTVDHSMVQPPLTYTLFFGTNPWLLFNRLHAILCERLSIIRKHTKELVKEYEVEMNFQWEQEEAYKNHPDREEAKKLYPVVHDIENGIRFIKSGNNKNSTPNPENYYQIMLQEMKNWLDGSLDSSNFEDSLRNMFGTKAYICFTMDKMINAIVAHLKAFISDNNSLKCAELFDDYYKQRINGCEQGEMAKQLDAKYEAEAEKLLINEKCYKIFYLNHTNPIVTVELIDTNQPESESDDEEMEKKESPNVVKLTEWEEFLEKRGMDLTNLATKEDTDWRNLSKIFIKRNLKLRKALYHQFSNENSNVEEQNSTPIGKKKLPEFFTSSGFCILLNGNIREFMGDANFRGDMEPDLFIRKGAPGISRKKHKKLSTKRRKNWIKWLEKHEKDVSATWFSSNCQTELCSNPRFKYLKFTKYTSKK